MLTTNSINSKDIREQVSLVDLLSRLGFNPVIPSAKEKMYISMIRDSDTRPSFSVNDKLSVWYDHGIGKGGNVIDFGLAYWPKLSFPEVLEKISEICALPLPLPSGNNKVQRRRVVKIPHYEIEYIKELGTNPVITEYLQSRKVFEQASDYLKEIYYYVEDHKKLRKHFFAAGWQNELGSWEVRNKYFKGCLGHKAITFIPGDEEKLSVFEGFINYLSWLTEHTFASDSILVLNTITLVFAAAKKAGDFKQVSIYFDRDIIGCQASIDFIKLVPHAEDCCTLYEGHNDYNDKLVNGLHQSNGLHKINR
jgi:hypothetical protein